SGRRISISSAIMLYTHVVGQVSKPARAVGAAHPLLSAPNDGGQDVAAPDRRSILKIRRAAAVYLSAEHIEWPWADHSYAYPLVPPRPAGDIRDDRAPAGVHGQPAGQAFT